MEDEELMELCIDLVGEEDWENLHFIYRIFRKHKQNITIKKMADWFNQHGRNTVSGVIGRAKKLNDEGKLRNGIGAYCVKAFESIEHNKTNKAEMPPQKYRQPREMPHPVPGHEETQKLLDKHKEWEKNKTPPEFAKKYTAIARDVLVGKKTAEEAKIAGAKIDEELTLIREKDSL